MAPDRGPAKRRPTRNSTSKRPTSSRPAPTDAPTDGASLISQYHALEKRLHQTTDPLLRKQILRRQEQLGGLSTYQQWSVKGGDRQKGGETSKWLVKQLYELEGKQEVRPGKSPSCQYGHSTLSGGAQFKLLDVGAIGGTAYKKYPFIHPTSIDLNPAPSSSVLKYDFFDFPSPASRDEAYDVVSLSLVLNFVGDLEARSRMLRRAHRFLRPRTPPPTRTPTEGHDPTKGYLYLVLPLACVSNSRYLTSPRLVSILATLGWTVVRTHESAKLSYWLLQPDGDGRGDGRKWKKEEVRPGAKRNNFCIKV